MPNFGLPFDKLFAAEFDEDAAVAESLSLKVIVNLAGECKFFDGTLKVIKF